MKVSDLDATHPEYDCDAVIDARCLFEGGQRMRKNVERFLIRNDLEDHAIFKRRCRSAHYVNYCGPMGGYFASFVGSQALRFEKATGDYWAEFAKDCDSDGTDFSTFFSAQLIEALTTSKAFWRIRFPQPDRAPESLADVKELGLDRAILVPVPTEQVIDWDCDDEGRYIWVRVKECVQRRPGTGQAPINWVTWTQWNNDGTAQRWQIKFEGDGDVPSTSDAPEVEPPFNPIGKMPIVSIELPPALYLMGHLASPQLELFRKRAALSWSMDRTCYAMPVLFSDSKKPVDRMGAGYYQRLGGKDRFEWPAPPSAPYATIGEYISTLKDEIYRVAQAMARGVDNNAAAVGRSGESKQADDRATEIVVGAYADRVREAAQRTVDLVAEGSGQQAPVCGGLQGYAILDPAATIEQFIGLQSAKIPSPTFMREAAKRAAHAFLPDISEDLRKRGYDEIDENLTDEEVLDTPEPSLPEMEGIEKPLPINAAQPGKATPPPKQ